MANDDKYPVESDRRRFVKGVVGGSALAGVMTTAAAGASLATAPSGGGGGRMQYKGILRQAGPAPRGMPQIPVEIDDDGYLKGLWPEPETIEDQGVEVQVSETEIADINYTTEWYQYCGLQTFSGIRPDADQDEYFRYSESSDYEWQSEVEGGGQVHVDDFEDYESWGNAIGDQGVGKPANATWRSQDVPPEETIPVIIIRSPKIEEATQEDEWLAETAPEGFIAIVNKCTHFCCVPGYKSTSQSTEYDAGNKIYCQCHQTVYDPFTIETQQTVALPRPEGDDE